MGQPHSKSHMTSTETQGTMAEFTLYLKMGFQKSLLIEQLASGNKEACPMLTSHAKSIKVSVSSWVTSFTIPAMSLQVFSTYSWFSY